MTAQQVQNPTFYPTPTDIIKQMVSPYLDKLKKWQILEPSAGNGAILDYLKDAGCRSNLYAIESDPELIYTLQGKNHKVIHTDFLTYSGDYLFDLIIMNPPFVNGDEHLLKAWDALKSGHIVCLLNEETLLNPYTAKRKLLKSIIEQNGSIDLLGECFTNADRQTDVRVALVRLEKHQPEARFTFEFGDSTEKTFDFQEAISGDSVALNDLTGAMLRQYEQTKAAYVDYIKAKKALAFYSDGLLNPYTTISKMADEHYSDKLNESYNGFMTALKTEAWSHIIGKIGMAKLMTNGVQSDFEKFKRSQGAMDLTRENIFSLIQMLLSNRGSIMERAVVDVFDIFTQYHAENRCHVEGWKTNSAWKVNRKIILPYWVNYGNYRTAQALKDFGDHFSLNHRSEYHDIDKVMCWLTGRNYDATDKKPGCYKLFDALSNHFREIGNVRTGDVFDNEGESEFFTFKFWKKGTLHITFKDEKLWEEFNYQACKGKNWLPQGEQRKESRKQPEPKPTTPVAERQGQQQTGAMDLVRVSQQLPYSHNQLALF